MHWTAPRSPSTKTHCGRNQLSFAATRDAFWINLGPWVVFTRDSRTMDRGFEGINIVSFYELSANECFTTCWISSAGQQFFCDGNGVIWDHC
jgi:hypothetical protein